MNDLSKRNIISVRPLNGRALRLEFSDGAIRLFDGRRLRGPRYIPLIDAELFRAPQIDRGDLLWDSVDIRLSSDYLYSNSVPYDENAVPEKYVPTKREVLGERIAMIIFPLMAIAGIAGIISWYLSQ